MFVDVTKNINRFDVPEEHVMEKLDASREAFLGRSELTCDQVLFPVIEWLMVHNTIS